MQNLEVSINGTNSEKWKGAIREELKSLLHNSTWKITELPKRCKTLDLKVVFTVKKSADESIDRFKARIVAKRFQQKTTGNVYAPVIDFSTVRMSLIQIIQMGGFVHQMDVKTAFSNGSMQGSEDMYMKLPKGIDIGIKEGQVLK